MVAEKISPAVAEERWLRDALATEYAANDVTLTALSLSPAKRLYRVDRGRDAPWLLRVAPPDDLPAPGLAVATVLEYVHLRSYPAPRLVRTVAGEPVLRDDRGLLLVSTFVEGTALPDTPEALTRLGRVVGRLHTLPVHATSLPQAGMLPATELAYARSRLAAVRERVPQALAARYAELADACERTDWAADLPRVLLHNDCHPGNAIQKSDGTVTLVDWEGAGVGPANVDLGFLLVSVALPLPRGWDRDPPPRDWRPPPPRLDRLAAGLDGYARERVPSSADFAVLPDAMRFRSLVAAACSFADQVRHGLDHDPAPWWRWRFEAAGELAAAVRQRLGS